MTTDNIDKNRREEIFNEMLENSEAIVSQGQQMGMGFYPQKGDRTKILTTLYDEICDSEGKHSFINKLTKKAIANGRPCIASEIMDPEYADAKELTDELYIRLYSRFIGLYFLDEEGNPMNLIGFTSLPGFVDIKTIDEQACHFDVTIRGIHIPNLKELEKDEEKTRLSFVYGISDILLEQAEKIAAGSGEFEQLNLNFETTMPNGELWAVLKNRGYELQNSDSLPDKLVCFTKTINKREMKNEGNTSRK